MKNKEIFNNIQNQSFICQIKHFSNPFTLPSTSHITLKEMSDNEDENLYVFQSDEEIRVAIEKNEVKLNSLKRAKRNWRKCMGCDERANLHSPTKEMRLHFCKSKKIYIQANDRVCDFHLQD